MDTLVSIEVVNPPDPPRAEASVEKALGWFYEVEARCSRFEPDSELMALCRQVGAPVKVSPLLYQVIELAVEVARLTGGAFDPTVGGRLEAAGFDESYRTGARVDSGTSGAEATYRDISLDPGAGAVTLRRPLVIDLGAVAKGFAMDLAARELADMASFSIDAGGDLVVRGLNAEGQPWRVGIQHPRQSDEVLDVLALTNAAVCTSGDYERRSPVDGGGHIVDARGPGASNEVASVTVVALTAMAADALSTAAFILGPERGLRLLSSQDVEGLIVTAGLERYETAGFARLRG